MWTFFITLLRCPVFLLCNIVWLASFEFVYFLLKLYLLVILTRDLLFTLVQISSQFVLAMKAKAGNHCAVSLQFTQSCHSGLRSQSDPPADPTVRWEGSSGCQAQALLLCCSAESPKFTCVLCCAVCCVVGRVLATEAVMVSEGPLSPDREERAGRGWGSG